MYLPGPDIPKNNPETHIVLSQYYNVFINHIKWFM